MGQCCTREESGTPQEISSIIPQTRATRYPTCGCSFIRTHAPIDTDTGKDTRTSVCVSACLSTSAESFNPPLLSLRSPQLVRSRFLTYSKR